MYSHKVVLYRNNTIYNFFYDEFNILNDPFYIDLISKYKLNGSIISENQNVSEDELVFEKTIIWNTQESFESFYNEYIAQYPDYRDKFDKYNKNVEHIGIFLKE